VNIDKYGKALNLHKVKIEKAKSIIGKRSKKLICLNDQEIDDFKYVKKEINAAFKNSLPEKSGFELCCYIFIDGYILT
jgi:hypothetical protein